MNSIRKDEPANKRYYITTAIDYPNAPPHIGHALEKVAADVVARYHRLQGYDTYFSIGLDENSQHVVKAAQEHQVDLVNWTNSMDEGFRLAWSRLNISNDRWIRTTEPEHFQASQELFRRAQQRGEFYKSIYSAWYCPNGNNYDTREELVEAGCREHPPIERRCFDDRNYFLV